MSRVLDLIKARARDVVIRTGIGASPLVFDSPHSGTRYPDDFGYACELQTLRQAEDTHVEWLFDFVSELDIAWVEALFPRSYLDANRSDREIDLTMIEGEWLGPVETDTAMLSKVRLGKGVLWKLTDDGLPLYDRKLSAAEAMRRIERCWRPYHAAVEQAIGAAHARHGYSIHINCHSMPSVAASNATEHPGLVHADFVLGDRDGTTANPRLTDMLAEFLRERGYSVEVNHPYKGVELVRRYSDPTQGRHSIQLEINRKLYMNEQTLVLEPGSARVKLHLRELAQRLVNTRPGNLDRERGWLHELQSEP